MLQRVPTRDVALWSSVDLVLEFQGGPASAGRGPVLLRPYLCHMSGLERAQMVVKGLHV